MRTALLFATILRVCADPNNLPSSNRAGEGFENRIAELVARDLGEKAQYVWWSQRKNFVRDTLLANKCDAIMGLPEHFPGVLATEPYYRSSYVFVYRDTPAWKPAPLSLFDPRLREARIGVHIVDANLAPPAQILARQGIVQNVKGYSLFGHNGESNPAASIVAAVEHSDIDMAIVWGPLGRYFGRQAHLTVSPIRDPEGAIPLSYAISIAVAPGQNHLRDRIQLALNRNRIQVRRILAEYGMP